MTRTAQRCSLLFALLLTANAAAQAQPVGGRETAPVEAIHLAGSVYLLTGGSGANSSALIGDTEVMLIDSKSDAVSAEGVLAALREITTGSVRYLINTHEHPDHTGGNELIGSQGATIVAHQGVRAVLAAGQRGGPPAPDIALPLATFDAAERMTLHLNAETIEIVAMPAAHTPNNTLVHFVDADIYHLGDLYTRTRYPVIAGGTLQGFIDAITAVLDNSDSNSRFIPGVGEVGDRADLLSYRDMLITVRDRVAALVADGKSAEDILAANPTAEFDAIYGDPSRLFLPPAIRELGGN